MNTFETVISADGTPIAVERTGSGQPVILMGGAFNDRSTVAGLAGVLAGDFTAVTYDRRGRGNSGDAASYAVEREIEDLAAVIGYAGEPAGVFGPGACHRRRGQPVMAGRGRPRRRRRHTGSAVHHSRRPGPRCPQPARFTPVPADRLLRAAE